MISSDRFSSNRFTTNTQALSYKHQLHSCGHLVQRQISRSSAPSTPQAWLIKPHEVVKEASFPGNPTKTEGKATTQGLHVPQSTSIARLIRPRKSQVDDVNTSPECRSAILVTAVPVSQDWSQYKCLQFPTRLHQTLCSQINGNTKSSDH